MAHKTFAELEFAAYREDIGCLRKALHVATDMLIVHEHGDSRAVSDEFVALTAVLCGDTCAPVMDVIDRALKRQHARKTA